MGFSTAWLALREGADRAARDEALARRAARAAGTEPLVVDLGSGTGATFRALTPLLPETTRWRFVDNDAALLELAAAEAGARAECVEADLGALDDLPLEGATLVTASALLDLMPEHWVRALASRLTCPFYAALSYDGEMLWTPDDPLDGAVAAAFDRHQLGDKGLGPALGPGAAMRAKARFEAAGFTVRLAPSPWRLGPDDSALQRALTEGIATAAAEAGEAGAAAWGCRRAAAAEQTRCTIGHLDLLALPGSDDRDTPC